MAQKWPKMTQNAPKWPKYDPKWPQMALEWPKMIQNGPKMTQHGPKLPQMAQIWRPDLRTFSAIFFYWKSGSANFFTFRMYGPVLFWCWQFFCQRGSNLLQLSSPQYFCMLHNAIYRTIREIQRTDAIFMKFKPVAIVAPASEISSTLRVRVTISESLSARFGCCAASVIISVATFQWSSDI